MGKFARDTAVRAVGGGRYAGEVDPAWNVLFDIAPNGGYVMALAARAMAAAAERPDPITVTAHFVRPSVVGPVEVTTEIVKSGRRHTTVAARFVQEGDERLRLLGTFGDLTAADGPTHMERTPPEIPPVDECIDLAGRGQEDNEVPRPPIFHRFEHRMAPDTMGWAVGKPLGRGEMGGWCRLADGEPIDSVGALLIADAFPPALFNAGGPVGWTPTVELTVQVRKRPADGWLAARFTTDAVTRGYLAEDGEIWDESGELVALSRQLAMVTTSRPR